MLDDFPNLARDVNFQMREAQRTSNRINPRKPVSAYIRIKLLKTKDQKKKSLEKNQFTKDERVSGFPNDSASWTHRAIPPGLS